MMDNQADLSRLNDIVVPSPVSWWPPAPGWWILFTAFLSGLVILLTAAVIHRRHNAYRRAALAVLGRADARSDPATISNILKRAALAAYPRDEVAALTGESWLQFLEQTSRIKSARHPTDIRPLIYGSSARGRSAFVGFARRWVKHHRAEVK